MTIMTDVMEDAARAVLKQLPLGGDNYELALASVMKQAAVTGEVQRKFSYAVSDKAAIAGSTKTATTVQNLDAMQSEVLPSLKLGSVVRSRQRKSHVKINQVLPLSAVEMFNRHYATSVNLEFVHTYSHDHAVTAASKKIEAELVMLRLRGEHADYLRLPSNGYDFSVIDAGGDWRYHRERKHLGVHTDAPYLDDRDKSRDVRRRMQLTSDAQNEVYVCRHKSQDCKYTAPFISAVHSLFYTMYLMEMCEMMASRGVLVLTGTAHLPEELDSFSGTYVDPDYDYLMQWKSTDARMMAAYIPPNLRDGFGKYAFPDHLHKQVRYSYPNGESRAYDHDYEVLREKLHPAMFVVGTEHGEQYHYEYKIYKRVGSLAFCEIRFVNQGAPAHEVQLAKAVNRPLDGYEIEFDRSLIHDFTFQTSSVGKVVSPRQYFTAVAAHALTQVRNPNFTVESSISLARSAAAQAEANGTVFYGGADTDSTLRVVTGLAAFCWAFKRSQLIDARVPDLQVAEVQSAVEGTLLDKLGSMINVTSVFSAAKDAVTAAVADRATAFAISKNTTFGNMKEMYDTMVESSTGGLFHIRDLQKEYYPIIPLKAQSKQMSNHVSKNIVYAMIPTYPTYELPVSKAVADTRQVDGGSIDLGSLTGVKQAAYVPSSDSQQTTLVEPQVEARQPVTLSSLDELFQRGILDVEKDTPVQDLGVSEITSKQVSRIIMDMIALAEAGESERDQTAREIFDSAFSLETRMVANMKSLRGRVKGSPTILDYQQGQLLVIRTLAEDYHKGTKEYDEIVRTLAGSRCIYPEKHGTTVQFGTGVLRPDAAFQSDKRISTAGQTFAALVCPDLRILNAQRLSALRTRVSELVHGYSYDTGQMLLRDEVAGSGKTYAQVKAYESYVKFSGSGVAIFAETNAAADEAKKRLKKKGVVVDEVTVSTIDKFLMNPSAWRQYSLVMMDEALRMHAGKMFAVMLLTRAVVVAFGNTDQIGFLPFTRFHKPATETGFPYGKVQRKDITRRIPKGRAEKWLQQPALYGSRFRTISPLDGDLVFCVRMASFETRLRVGLLYHLVGVAPTEELLIMVYTQDQALRLAPKLGLTNRFPRQEDLGPEGTIKYNACLKTIGESQGDDVQNSVVVRLGSNQEPLHDDRAQSIVALSRHKRRIGLMFIDSKFPSLIERCIVNSGDKVSVVPTIDDVESVAVKVR